MFVVAHKLAFKEVLQTIFLIIFLSSKHRQHQKNYQKIVKNDFKWILPTVHQLWDFPPVLEREYIYDIVFKE